MNLSRTQIHFVAENETQEKTCSVKNKCIPYVKKTQSSVLRSQSLGVKIKLPHEPEPKLRITAADANC